MKKNVNDYTFNDKVENIKSDIAKTALSDVVYYILDKGVMVDFNKVETAFNGHIMEAEKAVERAKKLVSDFDDTDRGIKEEAIISDLKKAGNYFQAKTKRKLYYDVSYSNNWLIEDFNNETLTYYKNGKGDWSLLDKETEIKIANTIIEMIAELKVVRSQISPKLIALKDSVDGFYEALQNRNDDKELRCLKLFNKYKFLAANIDYLEDNELVKDEDFSTYTIDVKNGASMNDFNNVKYNIRQLSNTTDFNDVFVLREIKRQGINLPKIEAFIADKKVDDSDE